MNKYFYVQGLCTLMQYNGLYPVIYEKTDEGYKKVKMVCSSAINGCEAECKVINNAVEIFPYELEWRLLDAKMDEK